MSCTLLGSSTQAEVRGAARGAGGRLRARGTWRRPRGARGAGTAGAPPAAGRPGAPPAGWPGAPAGWLGAPPAAWPGAPAYWPGGRPADWPGARPASVCSPGARPASVRGWSVPSGASAGTAWTCYCATSAARAACDTGLESVDKPN